MSFQQLLGQDIARTVLLRALSAGKLHHAYRFEGPTGVGKETAAFLLAQALVCATPDQQGGCGQCSPCRRALTLAEDDPRVPQHPDVVLVGRGIYPSALLGGTSEATGISVEQIRRIVLARLGYPPHEGRALVFIVRNADELTVSAANALLKTLEEPAKNTHFILLTARPMRLLDTIRSRTLAVRFGPLGQAAMTQLLERESLPLDVLPFAQGSLARARALSLPEARETRESFLSGLEQALGASHPAAALRFAEERPDSRDELIELLAYVASTFAQRARNDRAHGVFAEHHQCVSRAISQIEANGSPALVLESMLTTMMQEDQAWSGSAR